MDERSREVVRERAADRCEYCRLPQYADPFFTFHVEHIVAKQHRGTDALDNLALACQRCNGYKGPNLSSVAPESGDLVPLFHPRKDSWPEHFTAVGGVIIGQTDKGRATALLLNMNSERRVQMRESLLQAGVDPFA